MITEYQHVGFDSLDRLRMRLGRPADFWVANRVRIERFIESNKIAPIGHEHLYRDDPIPNTPMPAERSAALSKDFPWPRPFPGGMRIPHLHFKNEVFELNHDQWTKFSRETVAGLRAQLERAESISLENLIDLSNAIEPLV